MKGIIAILLLSFFSIAFSMPGLTRHQIHQIVEQINNERRDVYASNMREIRWSECLQKLAGDFLLQCNPSGSSNTMLNVQAVGALCESTQTREIIFNTTHFVNHFPIEVWTSQKQYCDNDQYECSDYLQLIDSGSFAVGCEMIDERMKCSRPGMTAVCYFAHDGVTTKSGVSCSQCEGGWRQCHDGLCSQKRIVVPGSGHGENSHSNGNHGNHELPQAHGNHGNHGNHDLPKPHGNHGLPKPHGNHGNHELPQAHGNHGNHDLPKPHGHRHHPHPQNGDNTWQH